MAFTEPGFYSPGVVPGILTRGHLIVRRYECTKICLNVGGAWLLILRTAVSGDSTEYKPGSLWDIRSTAFTD